MQDPSKTNQGLVEENTLLKQRVKELEQSEAACKRANDVLRESEEKYRILLSESPDPTFSFTPEGQYRYVNRAFAEGVGKPIEDIIGKSIWDVFPKEEADERFASLNQVFHTGDEKVIEVRVPRVDGDRYYMTTITPVKDTRGEMLSVVCSSKDITERHSAEDALRESEERFRAFMDNMPSMVIIKDKELRPLFFNRKFSEMFPAKEWLGKIPEESFPSEIADSMRTNDLKALLEGFITYEEEWLDKDGSLRVLETRKFSIDQKDKAPILGVIITDNTDRRRAEEALLESECKFRDLAEKSIVGIYLIQDGLFKYVNGEFAAIFGYSIDEIIDRLGPKDVIYYEDLPLVEESIRKRIEGEIKSLRYEFRIWTKKREMKHATVYSSRTFYQGKPAVIGTILDITESKRAEEALKKSEGMLRMITDNMSDMIRVSNLQGINSYVSPSHLKVLGYRPEERVGKSNFDIVHPDDIERIINVFSEGLSGNRRVNAEYRARHADGYYVWLETVGDLLRDDQGKVTSVVMSSRDITERKQAEEMLRKSDEQHRLLIENSHDIIYTLTPEGIFTFVSASWTSLLGHPITQVLGKPFQPFVHPDDLTGCLAFLQKVIDTGQRQMGVEYRVQHTDGSWRWHNSNAVPLMDETGKVVALEGSASDITDRKRADETLQISEKKYRDIFENAVEGIFQSTPEGAFLSVNPAMANMCGYASPEEMIARITDIGAQFYVYPEERKIFMKNLEEHEVDEKFEHRVFRKDGSIIWISTNSRVVRDDSGKILYYEGTHEDITDRKRSEDSLRQSESALRSVFLAAPVGICIMKNRLYQSANAFWCERFGYPEESIIGTDTRRLYENDEEYDRVGQLIYSHLRERGLASAETRLRRSDGAFRDVILTAAPLQADDPTAGTVVIVQDITERKQVEDELRESQQRLSDIIEFLPDATFVLDREETVIAWNRAIETMTGIKKEDMLGKGNYEYSLPFYGKRRPILIDLALHPDKQREKRYTAIQRVGDILFGESFTPNLPPGDIHLSATASVLRDSKGEIIAAIECIRDNTERKRMEERLNRAEKMEGLGRLAGGVAHDLNNVLGVLVGYSELLAEKLSEDNPLRRYAVNIQQSGLRGAAIIQDLLTLARRGVTVSEVVDLNRVVFDYLRTPEFEALKSHHPNVKVWNELEEGLLNIKGSPVHLSKTIMNLVSNAAEAISDQGDVTIRSENRYLDQPIRGYDDMQEGDYVVLTVSDSGRGISSQDIGKIFEPFYTKKVMGRSGTGLGLAVVWGTVKDHNGYIDVQSEEGKGTTFTLYFPVTRDELTKSKEASPQSMYMGRGESILVVDDVKEQRELAMTMLERLGYQVEAISSGEEAIDYLKNKKVDLVILDMIMDPGIDGLETYMRIIEINHEQKAIIVSGFSETDRVREAQEMGAGEFLRKPYILEKIGLAVRKELDKK